MVSTKPMDNLLKDDNMKDAVNEKTRYKGICKNELSLEEQDPNWMVTA